MASKKNSVNKHNISIKVIDQSDETNGLETSNCTLEFSGNSINSVVMSTLRRVIMGLLPTYAFNDKNIKFTKNSSVFPNDYMALRFSNFPIYLKKELNKKYIELKKLDSDKTINPNNTIDNFQILEYKATLGSAEIDKTSDIANMSENINDNITIVINVKNTTNSIINIMSNSPGVKYYYKSEQISHIYSMPLLIIQLQPNQELACTMIADLNIAMYNATYRPCSKCFVTEQSPNLFKFTLMSKRQISEKDMFIRGCEIIKLKINHAKKIFNENINKYKVSDTDNDNITSHYHSGRIIIEGEQHTLGNLISNFLQNHSDIHMAGYKVNHPNVNNCEIIYESKVNILDVIDNITDDIISLYDNIQKQIENLNNFGYQYV
jgi:DNA-directed RNA polymerase subunit L